MYEREHDHDHDPTSRNVQRDNTRYKNGGKGGGNQEAAVTLSEYLHVSSCRVPGGNQAAVLLPRCRPVPDTAAGPCASSLFFVSSPAPLTSAVCPFV